MVELKKSEAFNEFEGLVEDVKVENSKFGKKKIQYHLLIKPLDKEIKGESGYMHNWVSFSDESTEDEVQEDSIMGKYITQLIKLHGKSVKNLPTVTETFAYMKGKKYLFEKRVLGQAFEGHESKPQWLPVRVL